jgi:nucleolar GTP-binding protein
MIVANKTDVVPYEKLSADARARIEEVALKAGAEVVPMSNVSEENISTLKTTACDKLLEARVDSKLSLGKVKDDVLSRITVAQPKPRDNAKRGASIPDSVAAKASAMNVADSGRVTEKQLMWNNGGPGVYVCDYRKYYQLEDDEWRFDTIPEFMDGKNVVDFFDPEIEERLNALDAEEAELEAQGAYTVEDEDESDIDEEDMLLYEAIKEKQTIARAQSHQTKTNIPKKFTLRGRSAEEIEEQLENVGLPSEGVVDSTRGRKRERSQSRGESVSMSIDPKLSTSQVRGGGRSKSSTGAVSKRARSQSATRGPTEHSVAPHQRKQVVKKQREVERHLFKNAKSGESDREYYPKMVKHLNSGKRSLGTSTIGR